MTKYYDWAEKIALKLAKQNLIEIEDDEPAVSIDQAGTGSVYATYYFINGSQFTLRFADHAASSRSFNYWAEKYKDGEEEVFKAAKKV